MKISTLTYGKMQNSLHLVSEMKKKSHMRSPPHADLSIVNWTNNKQLLDELNLKLAACLINADCQMNHKDLQSHETPVFRAIVNNYFELVKMFVVEGMDMSLRNMFGNDALSRSIQLGRYKIARLLIAADSPIRVYSCFYKIPNIDEFKSSNSSQFQMLMNEEEDVYSESTINGENFLQFSIGKYEEFLVFLQRYTLQPRSLLDLCRLCVRNELRRPISKWLPHLNVPRAIEEIILLKGIENLI